MNLSQGTTEQASSVEELSASMVEIADQANLAADHAQSARTQSKQSEQEVSRGNDKLKDLIGAIDNINNKSNEIGKIVKTIDDIAFQTNILALNAAVEAARAGAAGKGFAVVADEVRNLAGKSAEAVQTTTEMIRETVEAIAVGSELAGSTVEAMEAIVTGTAKVTELVEAIAQASSAQAVAIGQVNTGVEQISSVVQSNSATSEESAATAEELSGQAQMLNQQLGRFQLKHLSGRETGQAMELPELPLLPEHGLLAGGQMGKY